MIKELPCGCKTKPIRRDESLDKYLLDHVSVWFDDPRCMDHEDGTDTVGFMLYKDNEVIQHLTRDGRLMVEKFKMADAIHVLDEFKKKGYDFSYGYMDMKLDKDGGYTMYCTGS